MKKYFQKLRDFFPSALPIGLDAFDAFCKGLFETYGFADLPSYRFAIASMIQMLPPTKAYVKRRYFVLSLKKAQATEVAYYVIEGIRKQAKDEAGKGSTEGSVSSATAEVGPKVS
jgi:hypothetical protein